mmetsp:Transcript_48335/g.124756  ORF Transcript_48335/g.124756 Transcript_48335/m.124756 type:complete len:526 (-) Transcript_48335:528-2105(-)
MGPVVGVLDSALDCVLLPIADALRHVHNGALLGRFARKRVDAGSRVDQRPVVVRAARGLVRLDLRRQAHVHPAGEGHGAVVVLIDLGGHRRGPLHGLRCAGERGHEDVLVLLALVAVQLPQGGARDAAAGGHGLPEQRGLGVHVALLGGALPLSPLAVVLGDRALHGDFSLERGVRMLIERVVLLRQPVALGEAVALQERDALLGHGLEVQQGREADDDFVQRPALKLLQPGGAEAEALGDAGYAAANLRLLLVDLLLDQLVHVLDRWRVQEAHPRHVVRLQGLHQGDSQGQVLVRHGEDSHGRARRLQQVRAQVADRQEPAHLRDLRAHLLQRSVRHGDDAAGGQAVDDRLGRVHRAPDVAEGPARLVHDALADADVHAHPDAEPVEDVAVVEAHHLGVGVREEAGGPVGLEHALLHRDAEAQRVGGRGEGHLERVALGADLVPAVVPQLQPHDVVVDRDRVRHGALVGGPEARGALHVRDDDRHAPLGRGYLAASPRAPEELVVKPAELLLQRHPQRDDALQD